MFISRTETEGGKVPRPELTACKKGNPTAFWSSMLLY